MQALVSFPLFQSIAPEIIDRFEQQCVWRSYEAGQMIIDHMDDTADVRFVATGSVRIVVRMTGGREVILNDLDAGRYFGELAAIDGGVRSANVTALTNTRLCIMPKAVFEALCREVPEVSWGVMQHLVVMVRLLSDRLSEFSFLKAKHRLYAELLRQSRARIGHVEDDSDEDVTAQRIISPMPKQGDIADRISSRREIVSRDMKELERQGVIEKQRGGLIILEPETLIRLAAEGWTE